MRALRFFTGCMTLATVLCACHGAEEADSSCDLAECQAALDLYQDIGQMRSNGYAHCLPIDNMRRLDLERQCSRWEGIRSCGEDTYVNGTQPTQEYTIRVVDPETCDCYTTNGYWPRGMVVPYNDFDEHDCDCGLPGGYSRCDDPAPFDTDAGVNVL